MTKKKKAREEYLSNVYTFSLESYLGAYYLENVSSEIETATNNLNSYKDSANAADLLKDDLNVYYEVDNELEEISDELDQVKSQ